MRSNFTRITRNRQYKKKKREKKKKKYKVGVSYWKVNEGQGESRGFWLMCWGNAGYSTGFPAALSDTLSTQISAKRLATSHRVFLNLFQQ